MCLRLSSSAGLKLNSMLHTYGIQADRVTDLGLSIVEKSLRTQPFGQLGTGWRQGRPFVVRQAHHERTPFLKATIKRPSVTGYRFYLRALPSREPFQFAWLASQGTVIPPSARNTALTSSYRESRYPEPPQLTAKSRPSQNHTNHSSDKTTGWQPGPTPPTRHCYENSVHGVGATLVVARLTQAIFIPLGGHEAIGNSLERMSPSRKRGGNPYAPGTRSVTLARPV